MHGAKQLKWAPQAAFAKKLLLTDSFKPNKEKCAHRPPENTSVSKKTGPNYAGSQGALLGG